MNWLCCGRLLAEFCQHAVAGRVIHLQPEPADGYRVRHARAHTKLQRVAGREAVFHRVGVHSGHIERAMWRQLRCARRGRSPCERSKLVGGDSGNADAGAPDEFTTSDPGHKCVESLKHPFPVPQLPQGESEVFRIEERVASGIWLLARGSASALRLDYALFSRSIVPRSP